MSKMQRDKGHNFERDVVNWLKDWGFEASRNLTQTRDSGGDISLPRWLFECKRYAKIAVYTWLRQAEIAAKPEQIPVVVAKADRQEPIVIMRFDKFLELMDAKENQTKVFNPIMAPDKASGSI
jgi:Holliday junction resolvase